MALTIDRAKTAFLSMHFQNDLVCEDGKFAFTGTAAHVKQTNCLANTKKVLEACRLAILHSWKKELKRYGLSGKMLAGMPVAPLFSGVVATAALTEGTWGALIHEEVAPQPGDFVVTGKGANSFYVTELDSMLRIMGIRTIALSGVATNNVVESTARYAADALYEVIILSDCCASFNQDVHSFTLNNVLPTFATISNSEEFIKALA